MIDCCIEQVVAVVEPLLGATMQVSTNNTVYGTSIAGQDYGNSVYYKITITNGNAATDTRAYDLSLLDTLPGVFTPDATAPIAVSSSGWRWAAKMPKPVPPKMM